MSRTAKQRMHDWYIANKRRAQENSRNWTAKNRDRVNARRRQLRKENLATLTAEHAREKKYRLSLPPEKRRERQVRKTLRGCSEYQILRALSAWKTFNGVCQACETPCSRKFDTDHDHNNMTFRGIIGSKCNKALGLVEDSVQRLNALVGYLERGYDHERP